MANALQSVFADIADAIRSKTGKTDKIAPANMANEIKGITGGGDSSELVKYVTFMSEDGTAELFKMPVLNGDDCKDPIVHGDISAPTKESTNTETYSHSGWSLVSGGEVNVSALENVTEDRVLYASFASSVRYYVVNFYLAEGELHETVQVTYGGTAEPTETPKKDDCSFLGWTPSNENITEDTDCYAQWIESVAFADASWATIAKVSEMGMASSMFAIGDEKEIDLGDYGKVIVQIAGFDHDTLPASKGGGTVGITCISKTVSSNLTSTWVGSNESYANTNNYYYYGRYMSSQVEKIANYMPDDLKSVMKYVNKKYDNDRSTGTETSTYSTILRVWLPSLDEMGWTMSTGVPYTHIPLGSKYPLFSGGYEVSTVGAKMPVIYDNAGNVASYYTRHTYRTRNNSSWNIPYITTTGELSNVMNANIKTTALKLRFGFCV